MFDGICVAEVEGHDTARDLAVAADCEGRSVAGYTVEVADHAATMLRRIPVHPVLSRRFTN